MTSSHTSLCQTFVDCAVRTWRYIETGAAIRLVPGEETLTDINLLEIRTRHPHLVRIWKFSKYREATQSGADWEWWIGGSGRWVGMRIQAKKVTSDTTPQRLLASIGRTNRYGSQITQLINGSRREGVYPLYCFYSACRGVPWPPVGSMPCSVCGPVPEVLGCTLAPATRVQRALQQQDAWSVLRARWPWSCLVCTRCWGVSTGPLVESAARLLRQQLEDFQFEVDPLHEQPPEYIQALREGVRPARLPPERRPDVARLLLIEEEGGA